MRVLRAYMDEIFTQQTLKGEKSLSNLVQVAQSNNPRDFAQLISQLPEIDTPTVFGLPTNIDRSVQRFNSGQVLAQLKSLSAVSVTNLRFDKEKWTEALGPLLQLWKNVYKVDVYKSVQISKAGLRSSDPVEVFVYMEMMAAMEMLSNVNRSVEKIIGVLQG
jgi:dynein heavy chain 2